MIRRDDECVKYAKTMFGGPGEVQFSQILNADEFCGHGRLFNRVVLKPGVTLGTHPHRNEFEVYLVLSGKGVYNDNGVEVEVGPGDVTVCPHGEVHGVTNNGPEDLEMVALILFDKRG